MNQKKKTLDPYDKISQAISLRSHKEKEFYHPSRICVVPEKQEILVCDNHGNEVEVFNMRGEFICSFGSRGSGPREFNGIFGICTFQERIFIADNINRRIQILDQNYNYLSSISTGNRPEWICCQKNGNIVLSTNESILLVYPDGKIETLVSNILGFDEIEGICCNDRDEIMVADWGNGRVQSFDKNGLFLSTIHFDRPIDPVDICLDQNENILLPQYNNNRANIFSPTGQLIQEISIKMPTKLCIFNQKIIIGIDEDFIHVFSN